MSVKHNKPYINRVGITHYTNECNELQEKRYLWIIPIQDYIDSYMDYINIWIIPIMNE